LGEKTDSEENNFGLEKGINACGRINAEEYEF
jgi:hypothetical protein